MPRPTILVCDDEPIIRDTLTEFLQQERFDVKSCGTGEDAVALASRHRFDAILCDISLPGIDGLDVMDRVLKLNPDTSVVLITAHATVETAVEAFQKGAHDYLLKPVLLHEVSTKLRRLLIHRELRSENQWLRRELHREEADSAMFVGQTLRMREAMNAAERVAATRSPVLITGESGTGKELMARTIHRLSGAMRGKFLAIRGSATPADQLENHLFGHGRGAYAGADKDEPGLFAHAGEGTVFLDDIIEWPAAMQGKLLRAIEHREFLPVGAREPVPMTARIIAATSANLEKEVQAGRFREDLYYRLKAVVIDLPPLRDRRADIPDLVECLLARHARSLGKSFRGVRHAAMQVLLAAPWRGNIRELDNALQRAAILSDGPMIGLESLPPDLQPAREDPFAVDDLSQAAERFEKLHIERILQQTPDRREAARRLNIGVSSLYRKIDQFGLAGGEK